MKGSMVFGVLIVSFLLASTGCAANKKVPYPTDYREWTHIKSMLIEPGHPLENPFQGLHHVYGNKAAVEGMKTGQFKDGATLVFDLLQYKESDKTIQESERKLLGVMRKDEKAFQSTGGWAFEGFAGDSKTDRLVKDEGKGCFACHASQKENGFVFSTFRK